MIRLTGLDGSTVLVAKGAIFRVRATVPSEGAPAVSTLAAVEMSDERVDPVNHAPRTLPAALVPKLQLGDVVSYKLKSYVFWLGGGVERVGQVSLVRHKTRLRRVE